MQTSLRTRAEELASAMHFLKGSAANLGFTDLANYCSAGEEIARAGDNGKVDLDKVAEIYNASKAQFMSEASNHISYAP